MRRLGDFCMVTENLAFGTFAVLNSHFGFSPLIFILRTHLFNEKVATYNSRGLFFSHMPEFISTLRYFCRVVRERLPEHGLVFSKSLFPVFIPRFLVLPQIVGGLADGTSGTLSAPDLDLNMEWQLGEEIMEHIEVLVLDEAASGQYQLKVIYLLAIQVFISPSSS